MGKIKSFLKGCCNIMLVLKGFFIGIANIIPGVSGGTLAIILGIYERLIGIISSIWKNFIENLKFIIPLGLGVVIAIVLGSKAIDFSLDKFPMATIICFIGLIIGGIPLLFKKIDKEYSVRNVAISFIIIICVVLFTIFAKGSNVVLSENLGFFDYIKLFFIGTLSAASMVIPGISGSFVLMTVGYYECILEVLSDITNFSNFWYNASVLAPFGLGCVIGIIAIARVIEFLLKRFQIPTYFAIIGFVLSSIFSCLYTMFNDYEINVVEIIVGVILAIIGAVLTYKVANYHPKKKEELEGENIENGNTSNSTDKDKDKENKKIESQVEKKSTNSKEEKTTTADKKTEKDKENKNKK